jgi:hypothetical protein
MIAFLISAAAAILVGISVAVRLGTNRSLRGSIAARWGRIPEKKPGAEDLKSISSYFVNQCRETPLAFHIDDITWRDLDMDEIFARLNQTVSTSGEECLYKLLREPCFNRSALDLRLKLIEYFQHNSVDRISVQFLLGKLDRKRGVNVTDYFFQRWAEPAGDTALYKLLGAFAFVGPVMLFINPSLGVVLTLLSLWVNGSIYFKTRAEISAHLEAMMYIVGMVRCTRRLLDAKCAGLEDLCARLRPCFERIRKIERKGLYLHIIKTDILCNVFSDYLNVLLLRELVDYKRLRNAVSAHGKDLLEVHETLGLIDSMISIASYRKSLPFYALPRLTPASPGSALRLEFEDICHPLVEGAIPNSLKIGRPVLVTGSNASGKSTL